MYEVMVVSLFVLLQRIKCAQYDVCSHSSKSFGCFHSNKPENNRYACYNCITLVVAHVSSFAFQFENLSSSFFSNSYPNITLTKCFIPGYDQGIMN